MNKQLFFLVAMHRSGNTVFSSIINQNPEIVCTAKSMTLEIMKQLFLIKNMEIYKNFPDSNSLDNVMDSIYDNYYRDWPQKYIIDRGPATLSGNFALLNKHYKKPFKCIILVRDLLDVLASYTKWYSENPNAFLNRVGSTDEEKLSEVMRKDGSIAKDLDAIKNVVENHADYGLTRHEAIQAAVRHVRRHTNTTDSSIKGTATITAGSMEIGIPVGKNPAAKNF